MTKQKFVDTDLRASIEDYLNNVSQKTAARWAADCTERILHYFEKPYPNDERPRKAIEAARSWAHGEISVGEARKAAFAAHAAAREAHNHTAVAAARAAGQAVATAHMIGHAIHASTYAVKSVAYATDFDTNAVAGERKWQYQHLLDMEED